MISLHVSFNLTSKSDGDDEEDEDDQLTGKANEAYVDEKKPIDDKMENYSETKEKRGADF